MPFIGHSPEGITAGEIARDQRREDWKQSSDYKAFNAEVFVEKINVDLDVKATEYDRVRTGFFGTIRGLLTRYEEKLSFLNSSISPCLLELSKDPANQNVQKRLLRAIREGIVSFTTFERQSGIAKLLEQAYFALTDSTLKSSANFALSGPSDVHAVGDADDKLSSGSIVSAVALNDVSQQTLAPVAVNEQVRNSELFGILRSVRIPQHSIEYVPITVGIPVNTVADDNELEGPSSCCV